MFSNDPNPSMESLAVRLTSIIFPASAQPPTAGVARWRIKAGETPHSAAAPSPLFVPSNVGLVEQARRAE